MKKIRIKVKTLIILIVSIVLVLGYILPFSMLAMAENISHENRDKAIKLYNIYLNTLSFNKKDEALYNLANLIVPSIDTYDIFTTFKGGGGPPLTKDELEEAAGYYEEILDRYEKSKYYSDSYKKLLDIYTALGQLDKAYEFMDWGKESTNEEVAYLSDLYRAFYYFVGRDYDKGLEIIDYYMDKGREEKELYYLKGHIYFAKEEYDKAKELYRMADELFSVDDNYLFGSIKNNDRSIWIDKILKHKGDYKIKGRATFGGKPIPFAQIYVRDISEKGMYSSSLMNFVAITDFNGEFETMGFKEGCYDIGIGISPPLAYDMVYMDNNMTSVDLYRDLVYDFQFASPMEMISPKGEYILKDNRITLTWEEIEGAEYYTISATNFEDPFNMEGSSTTFSIPDKKGEYKIKNTTATLDLNLLNSSSRGIFYEGEDMIINPQSILGTFHPGSNVPITINAYAEDDTLISSTLPLISFYDGVTVIKVRNREVTEGEELILHKEYDEAVAYYEELIEEDKYNLEALTYLSRLYAQGWRKDTKDIDKAFDYSLRLYELTHEKSILENLLTSIDKDDRDKYLEIGEKIFDMIPDESLSKNLIWEKGRYCILKDDFVNGIRYYESAKWDYASPILMYVDIYNREFDKALNRLKDEDFKFYYMSKNNLSKGIEGLKKLDENSKEWLDFKNFLYKLIRGEASQEEFNKIYQDIKEPSIKLILEEIAIDNYW